MILIKQKIFDFNFLKLSLRELKGSFNEFKIVMISIFLGVFIITAVGSLSKNLIYEINNKSSELLGGDFELSTTYQEFPIKIKKWLEKNGKTSQIVELRTMLTSNQSVGVKRRIVELKAVDQNWPLKGIPIIVPNKSINKSLKMNNNNNNNGALIDASLKKQLEIQVGDVLQLGKTKIQISGIIKKEPDVVVLLGDRYELLGSAIAAMTFRIPNLADTNGNLTYANREIELSPSGRQLDIGFDYITKLDNDLILGFKHTLSKDFNHINSSKLNNTVTFSAKIDF